MILLRGTDKVNLSANLPKTFNNPVGFERGLWRRKTGLFLTMPKRRVFERSLTYALRDSEYMPSQRR